ncbi:hypothetical protein A1F94_005670 [Pyrenophora tritici-repentis]|nr:hypothetical protein PtrV1_08259 [Pyrenophora tritici-repentis]KAG9383759.1 hypothetical protein A1F94_005670 [Pyrenophora tritici-repentis]
MDDSGVPVEEEGKVVETKIDETAILTDNEGKTVKSWLPFVIVQYKYRERLQARFIEEATWAD